MNDVQFLFVGLAALYVWECACWLRRGGLAFSSWLGRRWSALQPGTLIANQAGGFVLAAPLPPLGTIFVVNQFPISLSPAGVLGFVATNVSPGWRPVQTGKFFHFEEVCEARVHARRILVNGEVLATFATPALARRAVSLLQQLAKLKAGERAAAIAKFCRASLDAAALKARRNEFRTRSKSLRLLTNLLFAYVIFAVPAAIWTLGIKLTWLGLLLGLLALTTATAVCFRRAHRALYPNAGDERFTQTLTILLAPTTAMRALDALSRPLLGEFHPLAAAKVFLPPGEFRQFAHRLWRDLQHPALPRTPNDDPAVRDTELHSRQAWQGAVEEFLQRSGLDAHQLSQPPAPNDEACRAYCPRCLAQFTTMEGNCPDCGGLALVPFKRS